MHLPIELALALQCAKVYCNGVRLWVVACGYCASYDVTVSNLCAVYDAGMVCELDVAPEGASAHARALVDW